MSGDKEIHFALQILCTAPTENLVRLHQLILKAICEIQAKLASLPSPESSLLDALLKKHKKIERFLKQSAAVAIGYSSWASTDPRIADIEKVSQPVSDQERFWVFLAEQSYTLEAETWERETFGTSRVNDLVREADVSSDHHGHIQQFLESQNYQGKTATMLYNAI
ncbi:hypothetical protein CISG_10217 [Coccidioides immitis RMSCC 3703]|uniref:Uncharacterized protein n=1 Tax=Coccidioides immitis RMSCC 3703 TaxID=454286 RepID=A0A0J8QNB2_COCIT|nr:hypothetical protein CISG_10217 [Coccidioides immitis RMSCC 3703]